MSKALEKVINICHHNLKKDKEVLSYVMGKRKFTADTIRKFKLGAFPQDPDFMIESVGMPALNSLGVLFVDKNSQINCKFKQNNFVIPIYNEYGEPISIAGRCLDEQKIVDKAVNKYDNTPFNKGNMLFGLDHAIPHIRKKNRVLIVEGQVDTMMCHQHGAQHTVGVAGAYLRADQIIKLAKYTNNIVLCFDMDETGREAMNKILKRADKWKGMNFSCKELPPPYKDIDEYLKVRCE